MTKRILVVYYTRSGITRKIAGLIHQEIGGIVREIEPEVPYPSSYNEVVEQAKTEIRAGYRPALQSTVDDVDRYV